MRPIAKKRNIELTLETIREVTAEVDEVKLSQALNNLVENAVKYNREDGWVRVTLDADHKFFTVRVADSGIGIPEEFQTRIFERFYRVDKARSRETGAPAWAWPSQRTWFRCTTAPSRWRAWRGREPCLR